MATAEQVSALLRAFEEEYRNVIKEGKSVDAMITSKPDTAIVGKAPHPSPELYAVNKLLLAGRGAITAALLNDVPTWRNTFSTGFLALCGAVQVTPQKASAMEEKRGVGGYWIAWPGVDISDNAPTLIYFHGGGMVAGDARYLFGFFDRLSQIFGVRVLSVEYRLCPEATTMEATADGIAAYRHVVEDLKVSPQQVFLAGESGGGQLLLFVLQAIAKQKLPSPAAAWAISPVCTADDEDDKTYRAEIYQKNIDQFFPDDTLMFAIERLLRRHGKPDEIPGKDARVSPLYGDFTNVCPLYFSIGSTEIFRNEGIATHKNAQKAGVKTKLVLSAHGAHAYPVMNTPEAIVDIVNAATWMKQFSTLPQHSE